MRRVSSVSVSVALLLAPGLLASGTTAEPLALDWRHVLKPPAQTSLLERPAARGSSEARPSVPQDAHSRPLLAQAALATVRPLTLGVRALPVQQVPGAIRGTVRNSETGGPISGAQVSLGALGLGIVTNQDGRYLLVNVPAGTYEITVQIIGYATERRQNFAVAAAQTAVADFAMRTEVLSLSEIVVTGVTEATSRARIPFTVARVGAEAIPVPPPSAVAALQGKVAGALVVPRTQPGEGALMLLRTPTSINRSNDPLIVVDGTILTENAVDLSSLDIESIEVVKGAAAASLYGSRAASGVIQIRTRRGSSLQEGRTRLSLRTEYGFNSILHPVKIAKYHPLRLTSDGTQFVDRTGKPVGNDPLARTLAATTKYGFQDQPYPGGTYNHIDQFFTHAPFVSNQVSLGSNSGNTSWLATGSVQRNDGITREIAGYDRADFRVNLDHRPQTNLSFSSSLFHMRSKQDDLGYNAFDDFSLIPPDVNLLQPDPDGSPYIYQPDPAGLRANPLYRFWNQVHDDKRQRTLASADLRYNPLGWLAFDVNGSYDRSDRNQVDYIPKGSKTDTYPDGAPGTLIRISENTTGINASTGVNVTRDFGPLRTRTMLRAILEREDVDSIQARGDHFSVGGLPDLDALLTPSIRSEERKIRSSGYFLNTELDYADKYIFSGLIRRDGSSLFGPEQRWHTYYRAAGAYRMAQEPWWPFPAINEFKLRYSRGTAGGRPNFADRFEVFTVQQGGGLELNTLGNESLKPEKTTEQEFGLDMVLLGRLSLQLTYARQRTVDELVQVPLPRIFGYGQQWANAGTIEGQTYEATIEARVIDRPDLTWSVNLVADRSRNKITEYNRPCHTAGTGWRCAGERLGMIYGRKALSSLDELHPAAAAVRDQFQINDDGLVVWVGPGNAYTDGVKKDLWGKTTNLGGIVYNWGYPIWLRNAQGAIIRTNIGDSNPDLGWGLSNTVQWKGFNLYVLTGGQFGGDIEHGAKARMYQWNRHADADQFGKPEELKKPTPYYSGALRDSDNWFVEDATFVKLREVALRYTLSPSVFAPIARLGMERVVLSLIGRNLYVWTDYGGYDPEGTGGDNLIEREGSFDFPSFRTLTATIEVIF